MHCTILEVKVVTQNKDKCLEKDTCNRLKRKNVKIKTSVWERILIKVWKEKCENEDKCLWEGTYKSLEDKCENKDKCLGKCENKDKCLGI